jgi:alpha-tubulin suppressor-like RCC1 family protein
MTSNLIYKYGIYCNTAQSIEYIWDTSAPTQCPVNNGHSVNTSSVYIADSAIYRTISGPTSVNAIAEFMDCDTSSGSITINLPDPTLGSIGVFRIRKKTANNSVFIYSNNNLVFTLTNAKSIYLAKSNGSSWTNLSIDNDIGRDSEIKLNNFYANKAILTSLFNVEDIETKNILNSSNTYSGGNTFIGTQTFVGGNTFTFSIEPTGIKFNGIGVTFGGCLAGSTNIFTSGATLGSGITFSSGSTFTNNSSSLFLGGATFNSGVTANNITSNTLIIQSGSTFNNTQTFVAGSTFTFSIDSSGLKINGNSISFNDPNIGSTNVFANGSTFGSGITFISGSTFTNNSSSLFLGGVTFNSGITMNNNLTVNNVLFQSGATFSSGVTMTGNLTNNSTSLLVGGVTFASGVTHEGVVTMRSTINTRNGIVTNSVTQTKINNIINNWTTRTSAADNTWVSVCWAPELQLFVAIALSGTNNRVMTSTNGINWTTRTSANNNQWRSVCWSPELSLFVAVSDTGTGNRVMTSSNGIDWTARSSAADNSWRLICWSPNLSRFVAVSVSGTGNRVMTSDNGIDWVSRTSPADNSWWSVCWSPELNIFVAVSDSGTDNRVMTSPDGITWTSRTSAANNGWRSVCWSPELGLFVAVANAGTYRAMSSPDGINWTIRTNVTDNNWICVIWSPELNIFIAVGDSGTNTRIMTSNDGINWTTRTNPVDNQWFSICWAAELGIFVSVAGSGTGNRVMTSSLTNRVTKKDNNYHGSIGLTGDYKFYNIVTNGATFTSGITLNGNLTTTTASLTGGITLSSGITFNTNSSLTNNGTSILRQGVTFSSGVTMTSQLTNNSTSLFLGGVTFNSGVTFGVGSTFTNNSTSLFRGGVTMSSGATFTNQLTGSTALFVGGVTHIGGVTVDGQMTANSTSLFLGGASFASGVTMSGQMTAQSTSLFQNGVTFLSGVTFNTTATLTNTSTSIFNDGVTMSGGITFNTSSSLTNNSSSLFLGGVTFNGGVTMNNQFTANATSNVLFRNGVTFRGGVTTSGQFTNNSTTVFLNGVTLAGGVTTSGQFTVNSSSLFRGGVTFTGGVTMSGVLTANSTSLFQGGVTFNSGVTFNTSSSLVNNSTSLLRGGVTFSSGVTTTSQLTANSTSLFQGGVTFASMPTIDISTNQLLLRNTTLNAPSSNAVTYNIPDSGSDATFIMTEGNQTINGYKLFNNNSNTILAGNIDGISINPIFVTGSIVNKAIIYQDGTLKMIGNNLSGQLGIGYTSVISNYNTLYSPIGMTNVSRVAIGGGSTCVFVLALLNTGEVYGWGNNSVSQLGLGYTSNPILTPTYIINGVSNIACSSLADFSNTLTIDNNAAFSLFLMTDGTVRSCGSNHRNQLGHGNVNNSYLTPTTISTLSNVVKISCGFMSSAAVLSNGTARTWGANDGVGKLCQNTSLSSLTATPGTVVNSAASTLTNIKDMVYSANHGLILTTFGEVLGCGDNSYGQLSTAAGGNRGYTIPNVTSAGITVIDISAYNYSSGFLLSNNTIKTVGDNSYSQLGFTTASGTTDVPTLVSITNITSISRNSYANNMSIINTNNDIYSWGNNNFGILGNGNITSSVTPVLSNIFNISPTITFNSGVTFESNVFMTSLSTNSSTALNLDANNMIVKTSSSQRYKTDILDIPSDFSNNINNLRPVSYKFIADSLGITNYGLIAEEVNNIYPDIVCKNSNNEVESVKYDGVSILLLHNYQKAYIELQNLKTQINQLNTEITQLETQINALMPSS